MQNSTAPTAVRTAFERLNAVPLDAGPEHLLAAMRAQGHLEERWPSLLPLDIPAPDSAALAGALAALEPLLDEPTISLVDRLTIAAALAELRAVAGVRP